MVLVKDLLTKKDNVLWTVPWDASVKVALGLMAEKKIGALMVLHAGELVGLFSERDYARKVLTIPDFSLQTPVNQLMTRRVFYVTPEESADECMALMTEKQIRHLPVMDEGILVGMISIGDIVKETLSEMDSRIRDLEEYLWLHLI
jgi:CBS domain-containing protein